MSAHDENTTRLENLNNHNRIAADYGKMARSQAVIQQKCMYGYAGKGRQCHSIQ